MVYVLSKTGQPLMPTEDHRKVRLLLKSGQAKVVQRTPFTIQLFNTTHVYKQDINLGVDAGSKVIGLSATTPKKELFAEEVIIRNDITKLISVRSQHRHSRRNRTIRYRQRRSLNRANSKQKEWISPSVRSKIKYHLKVIDKVYQILPITKLIVETASFDTQKIQHSKIKGIQYQQGPQLGFWNVREYVLFRDNHECQYCHGRSGDNILNVHHIESRQTGGNSPNNLITLCKTCHQQYHNGDIKITCKRLRSMRDASFMSIMKKRLIKILKEKYDNVEETFGYITKYIRINSHLLKTHVIDAKCISKNPLAISTDIIYKAFIVRRHNRKLHQDKIRKGGNRKVVLLPKYVFGFKIFDKVLYKGNIGFIFARRSTGYFDIRNLSGTRICAGASYKKLKLLEKSSTMPIDVIRNVYITGGD